MYDAWEFYLPKTDPKWEFLLTGIQHGFHILEPELISSDVFVPNYRSATNPDIFPAVQNQIRDEIVNDRYLVVQEKPRIVSALGAIRKSKVRLLQS